jgi:uncharacterized protein YkwD
VREQEIVTLINQRREENGCLVPVALVDTLTAAARKHSNDMALNNFVGHTGSDGSTAAQRMREAGHNPRGWQEIIAAGSPDARGTVEQWMGSQAGHREAILNCDHTIIGVGYAAREGATYTHYWTAVLD